MKTTTAGIFTDRAGAEEAIEGIKQVGVATGDISCVYKDEEGDMHDAQTGEKMGTGAAKGATTGAVIGAIAGLGVANGILPGLGTLFVAGPLAAALGLTGAVATTAAGAATGAVAGGLIGALTNLGIHKEDAELYEKHVSSGDVLVVTHSDAPRVAEVLASHGATEIREYPQP
jgi:uncharacterized membrane protein